MNCTAEFSAHLDAYLIGFIHRNSQASEDFVKVAEPYLLNLAHNFACDMPSDLHRDIVEQAYINLLGKPGAKFNPLRGSAKTFLYDVVRNATLQVRANYCPPGQPKRDRKPRAQKKQEDSWQEKQTTVVSINEVGDLTASRDTANEIMARCDARKILSKAPRRVAAALYRIHFIGEALNESARHIGVGRFKLKRLINTYALQFRETV